MSVYTDAIAALEQAEQSLVQALKDLWVPFDPATGTGAVFSHDQAARGAQSSLEQIAVVKQGLQGLDGFFNPPADAPAPVTPPASEAPAPQDVPVTPTSPPPPADAPAGEPQSVADTTEVPPATDAAIAHAEATGVDLSQVEPTGAQGQIIKADVQQAAAAQEGQQTDAAAAEGQ